MFRFKVLLVVALLANLFSTKINKPTLYLIGDSTVNIGNDKNADSLMGWGTIVKEFFDTTKISIQNDAMPGRSSRTFLTEGHWDKVLSNLKPGDYLIIQFGHNDGSPINDSINARGSIKGIGQDSIQVINSKTYKRETVHTYGWYLNKYVVEAKKRNAIPIICSPVPKATFIEGKVSMQKKEYRDWAFEISQLSHAFFIDLFTLSASKFDSIGQNELKNKYFTKKDDIHTNRLGAELNARSFKNGLRSLQRCDLKYYLK